MTRISALLRNENMKIYRRLRCWLMIAMIPLLVTAGCILDTIYSDNDPGEWREAEQSAVNMTQRQLSEPGLDETKRAALEKQLQISQYRLDHDIPYYEDATMWGTVGKSASFISLIIIFTAIVAADIVASEFSWGTIKLLLIRPAGRTQILLAKYAAVLQYAFILLILLFVSSMAIGGLFFGFDGAKQPHVVFKDDQVQEMSSIVYHLQTYALKSVNLVMIVSFAFMISTVFRSSAMSIALSLTMLFVGDVVTMAFSRYEWVKYWLFANTNLAQYLDGAPPIEGMTLTFSICVLLVYFFVFTCSSWLVFTRRDVTNG